MRFVNTHARNQFSSGNIRNIFIKTHKKNNNIHDVAYLINRRRRTALRSGSSTLYRSARAKEKSDHIHTEMVAIECLMPGTMALEHYICVYAFSNNREPHDIHIRCKCNNVRARVPCVYVGRSIPLTQFLRGTQENLNFINVRGTAAARCQFNRNEPCVWATISGPRTMPVHYTVCKSYTSELLFIIGLVHHRSQFQHFPFGFGSVGRQLCAPPPAYTIPTKDKQQAINIHACHKNHSRNRRSGGPTNIRHSIVAILIHGRNFEL